MFDVAGRLRQAINDWFRELVAKAIDPAVDLAARSVLATPDLTDSGGRVRELWQLAQGLANTGYVLVVTAGGVVLMTNESLQARYGIKEVAPRLVVGIIASNTSLVLIGWGIEAANGLSRALLGPGVDPLTPKPPSRRCWSSPGMGPPPWRWSPGWWSCAGGGAGGQLCAAGGRAGRLDGGGAAGPGLPWPGSHEAVARWWWRAMAACLAIPVAQSLVLGCALRVFFHADGDRLLGLGAARLVDLLAACCLQLKDRALLAALGRLPSRPDGPSSWSQGR